jgi:fructose-1,6-bisphosphatase/inositol monophosphatase family enzyme
MDIVGSLIHLVEDIIKCYRKELIMTALKKDTLETKNPKHPDNFLSAIDLALNAIYKEKLAGIFKKFIYVSEEEDPQPIGCSKSHLPEMIVLVDPLDTSELAVRALCGYTHLLVYSLVKQQPVIAIVGDFFHSIQLYYAFQEAHGSNKAFLKTTDGEIFNIYCSHQKTIEGALVTNYSMKPISRFGILAAQKKLLNALGNDLDGMGEKGRIGVDFGSVGLCHVAAGFTDAMIEVAKGFKLWDLLPGQFILQSAGGYTVDENGKPLTMNLNILSMEDINKALLERRMFIACGNSVLLHRLLELLIPHE